jgi:hypothetical protein
VVSIIADAAEHPNYTDGNGFDHYLTKIADVAANGDVSDLRIEADHEAKIDPHSQYLTHAEGDAAYDAKGGLAAHTLAGDPHSQYLKEADAVSETDAKAGVATTVKAWSALRVKQAIQALVQSASETVAGIVERATQAETDAGWDDTRYVSPKKLTNGFVSYFATNGYVIFPSWMKRFSVQWGYTSADASSKTVSFPTAFPTACRGVFLTAVINQNGGIGSDHAVKAAPSRYSFLASINTAASGFYWFAIGN